jgi:hypothetical protein
MLRAGHRMDLARAVVQAADMAALEQWAAEPEEEDDER